MKKLFITGLIISAAVISSCKRNYCKSCVCISEEARACFDANGYDLDGTIDGQLTQFGYFDNEFRQCGLDQSHAVGRAACSVPGAGDPPRDIRKRLRAFKAEWESRNYTCECDRFDIDDLEN